MSFHVPAFGTLEGFHSRVDHNQDPFADFVGPYFTQVQALREGHGLSEGYMYPPTLAILMLPLGALGPAAASWIWLGVLSLASMLLFVVGLRWLCKPSPSIVFAYSLAFGLSFPWLHDLHWGQVSTLVWALTLYGMQAWSRSLPKRAAFALSLAISIKLFPVGFLLLYVLAGDRRGLAWVAGFCGLWLLALPISVLGGEVTLQFYAELFSRLEARGGSRLFSGEFWGPRMSQFAPAVISRAWGGAQGIWLALAWGLPLCVLGLALRGVCTSMRSGHRGMAVALLACMTPLLVSPSWIHYFVWLPMVQIVMWQSCRSFVSRLLTLISLILCSTPFYFVVGGNPRYGMAGFLLLASLALLLAYSLEGVSSSPEDSGLVAIQ